MKTIKECKIKIESVIENLDEVGLVSGDAEKSVTEAEGFLHSEEASYLISYRESGEGGEVTSDIELSDGRVVVRRRGAISSELVFAEGMTHTSIYSVPPYKFDAEVKTRRIRTTLSDKGGSIDLFYNMKIGGAEKSARMKIWISTI